MQEPGPPLIDLTLAGVPPEDRGLLIAPDYGFPIDVTLPAAEEVLPTTIQVSCIPWSGADPLPLREPFHRRPDGATFVIPEERSLSPGSYKLVATVDLAGGGSESVALDIAVRKPVRPAPLAAPQWIRLDFDADRDGDSLPDFPDDLAAFGLASGISAFADIMVEAWVIDETVARAQAFYDAPNPSRLPGGDPVLVRFSSEPPDEGPFTRICVAGETPEGGRVIGNVLLDPGNGDPSDEACDDYLPSGVFPRELRFYEDDPAYQRAFGELQRQPVGSHPLDRVILGSRFDSQDPAQQARYALVRRAVETFAQVVASVAAHEAGHAMGLVPPGVPGRGLYGGEKGATFTHNLTRASEVPEENLLMNPGPTFRFEDLAGIGEAGLPRIRALNYAYLQGRILLDPTIDGVYMPPEIDDVSPTVIDRDGPPVAMIEIRGRHLGSPPTLTLSGLTRYAVPQAGVLSGHAGGPDTLMATLLVPNLLPGVYDVELTNPDGQSAMRVGAIEVR